MENKYCLKFVSGDGLIDNPDLVTVKVEPDDEVISSVENCFGYSATRSLKQEDTSEDKSYHDSLWNGSNTINDFGLSSDLQHSIVRPVDPDCDKYPMTIAECSQDSKEEVQQLISNGRNDFTTGISTSNFDFCLKTEVKVEDDLEGAGEPSEDYEDAEHFMDNTGNIWDREEGGLLEENVDEDQVPSIQEQGESNDVQPAQTESAVSQSETANEAKPYKCNLCSYCAARQSYVRRHMAVHIKTRKHKCELCEYSANVKSSLRRHIDTVHLKIKLYKCHLCDHSTSLQHSLNKHIRLVHLKKKENSNPLKRHQCHFCDFSTKLKKYLKSHIDHIHVTTKNYKCDRCDYNAPRRSTVQNHIEAVHLKLKKYKCRYCDFATSRTTHLKSHTRIFHLKNLMNEEDALSSRTAEEILDQNSQKSGEKDKTSIATADQKTENNKKYN